MNDEEEIKLAVKKRVELWNKYFKEYKYYSPPNGDDTGLIFGKGDE